MGKVRTVPRPLPWLIAITVLVIAPCLASAQNTSSSCSLPATEISRISRPTGVLRADPNANETASQKIAADVGQACANLSSPTALSQAQMKISDNNIIVSGTVPSESDGQQLVNLVTANADGRTVFNRLEVRPPQIARN